MLLVALSAGGPARAEGVEGRALFPSSKTRIRGASSVKPVPWGFLSLGGPALRQLKTGKANWETLHTVAHDSLYRVAADASGRILAIWEKEPQVHLFVPALKKHVTFARPGPPSAAFRIWMVDDILFSKNGADAILLMEGLTGNTAMTTVAYRIPLDGVSPPAILFQQTGYQLYATPRMVVFAVPKNLQSGCNNGGCWPIAEIAAYELGETSATRKTLVSGAGDRMDITRKVWGGDEDRMALLIFERPNVRHVLRWQVGEPTGTYTPLPKGPGLFTDQIWLTRSGDLVEAWLTDESKLEIRRHAPGGGFTSTVLPPMVNDDPDAEPDLTVHTLKERKNGDIVVHWGNHMILLHEGAPPRVVSIEPILKRRNEWANADIYIPEPEAFWVGIEVGASRDFAYLTFADLEKNAKPLP